MQWYAYANLVLFPVVLGLVIAFGTAYLVRRALDPRLIALERAAAALGGSVTTSEPGDVLDNLTVDGAGASSADPHAAYRRPAK